jgi:hypothetical protein
MALAVWRGATVTGAGRRSIWSGTGTNWTVVANEVIGYQLRVISCRHGGSAPITNPVTDNQIHENVVPIRLARSCAGTD